MIFIQLRLIEHKDEFGGGGEGVGDSCSVSSSKYEYLALKNEYLKCSPFDHQFLTPGG